MKKCIACFCLGLLLATVSQAQDSVRTRIVLIGDGGQFTEGKHPVSEAIKRTIPMDSNTVVLYLGDNVYKVGLPDDQVITYTLAKSVLDSQLSIVENTKARLYMIPGNHDWNNGAYNGIQTILREQDYVNLLGKDNVRFVPENACPGPVEIEISDDVVLIVLDTQWWLHPYDKPGIESDCPYKTKDEVLTQLDDMLNKNFRKLVILATHHPLRSNGIHGGYFGLKQHVFPFTDMKKNLYIPLPIIGSIYPITRSVFGTPQDLKHPVYANMIHDIEKVSRTHPNVVFVAGHEHNLQLLKDTGNYHYIVSGSGSKTSRVNKSRKSEFVSPLNGFATLEVSRNLNVRVSFYTVSDSLRKPYSENILNFARLPEVEETSPIKKEDAKFKDTVNVAGSIKYSNPTGAQKFFIGTNYREEWGTVVNMKVFHLRKEKGGLKITGLGGGKQTKSLQLEDKDGGEWALRTIDKDPAKAIPENFRNSIGETVVKDLISASHPYGAMAVTGMADALGVIAAKPELFFVPDDPAFGYYQPMFANTVCMLESRNPTPDGSDSKSTGKLLEKMVEDNDQRADQKAVLTARLLDMLIADWDRHLDQWKWGTRDTTKGKIFYPIPKDRDQAFSRSNGLLIGYASRRLAPFLKGFRSTIPKIEWLNWSARDFDRAFLNKLSGDDWKEVIDSFQHRLTDSVITGSVKRLPPEVFAVGGEKMISKLKSRRDAIPDGAMRYYRFISHYVNIVGSNKPEYFRISEGDKGTLKVAVFERSEKTDTAFKIYERSFKRKETRELRLYGLNGNDRFESDAAASSRIKLRIIGGRGADTFDLKGNVRAHVYDMDTSVNYIIHKRKAELDFSTLPEVNDFEWVENQYPIARFPRLSAFYNPDDGFLVGAGYYRRTYGFRKVPYATMNRFDATYAWRGAYKFRYNGEFNGIIRKYDLLLAADFVNPTLNNFFGLGNTTKIDPDKSIRYYLARYEYFEASALLRKVFFRKIGVMAGPYFYQYWFNQKDNDGKILERPELVGLDSLSVYNKKTYVGGRFVIDLDNLNNELFPTRGIQWKTEFSFLSGQTKNANALSKITSDMTVYASLSSPAKLVTVLRLGGGHIFSKNFEYFQAVNLGANNYLRGFRKNRFAGQSLAYASLEMRLKLFTSRWYVMPGDVGLVGFHDVGRVWMPGQDSRRWHNSSGGGIYFVPFNYVIISAIMAFSREENLFNVSAGTKINITF